MEYRNTSEFPVQLDQKDELAAFRTEFFLPQSNNSDTIYFCGNSLGLQPKTTPAFLGEELRKWQELAVDGHFKSELPWTSYQKQFKAPMANLIGALPDEVVAMNSLTINLHLMMVSFYRPSASRFKIITEAGAFPSDMYAFETQVKYHGFDPEEAIVEVKPREGEELIRTEDIIDTISQHGERVALVLFSGVHYYTGQYFDLEAITRSAHQVGAFAGFDLAHAVGNVALSLHQWEVDFAVWCTYKYLNAGPGATAGAFIHEKHGADPAVPRFAGWWGHREEERFKMEKSFKPIPGADGWQVSNGSILAMAGLRASLEIFERAGFENLRSKSLKLTGYLHFLLTDISTRHTELQVITPSDSDARGCQLSISIREKGREVFEALANAGVVVDWREPNVIRVAPVPLYNTFSEVYRFSQILDAALDAK